MKKILSVILFMFLLGNVFCQIKEIGCNGGTTTLQKIADTVNSNFDYIDTEITDTIPLSGLVYIKSQTDSICNAKIDSSLTDVSTDTTYLYLVIDSLKARVNILEDTVIIHKNQIAELYQLVYAAFDSMNVTHPIVDATSPEIDSAHTANDSTIYLFASELLNEDSIPVADSFYVTENGVRMGVQTVSITNDTIILETDSTIAYNSNLLVDWMGDNIYDLVGNSMDVFSDTSIVNNVEVNTSFNATYQAIYDSMTTKPDLIYAGYQNEFVDSMVIKGYWDRIPSFFFWAQQYNTDGEALMDWKFREHATIVGSPVHTPHQGFYTDGAGDGINSHFNLTTDGGGIMTQYDASLVVYLVNDIANGDYYDAGASNGTAQFSLTADYGGSAYTRINAGTATSATNTNSSGLFCGTRTSETRQELYRGFTSLAQTTSNTASIPNFDVYFLCRNVSGTASDRSPNTQFLGFIADGFTDEEWSEIATICERLADHYSVGVH